MRRLALALAVAATALVAARAAFADGPIYVTDGGAGAASHNGAFHYVALPNGAGGTLLVEVRTAGAEVYNSMTLPGSWGTALIGSGSQSGQGLSRDGRTLVLESTSGPLVSPAKFLLVDPTHWKVLKRITLPGRFTFDALSPDGSRMYLIQYAARNDLTHYIVREYDLRTNRLLPGKIAARDEDGDETTMAGYAMTRTTSAHGRWVYTLYQKPSGEPFIHALDTVRGVAHCIDLPANENLYNIVLSMSDEDRTLAVHWRSGRPWVNVAVGSWRVSYPSSASPWTWIGAGIGAGLAVLAGGGLLLRRRRRREELEEHPGQELGLA
jgi:LPXTG-motif cell wall-anchored protein